MRGEHTAKISPQAGYCGSSPHAWGTLPTLILSRLKPVHPHMRGEHQTDVGGNVPSYGSSPHAWGTPLRLALSLIPFRFIPTCVGNTRSQPPLRYCVSVHPHMRGEHTVVPWHKRRQAVHPHMRGEHLIERPQVYVGDGSSPHAWGTLLGIQHIIGNTRFIPTCVGNTCTSYSATCSPRFIPTCVGNTSSSARLGCCQNRFIPTCVGNTP